MVKLLIIADDFTGALDTGIQFAKCGICTQVFTKHKLESHDIKPDTEVLVVDTESRPMSKKDAYEAVHSIASWAVEQGIEIIFKKTDSALRGNVGIELQAIADLDERDNLFFLPGYPEIDRITEKGIHYIGGELLENSVFGKDPFEPVVKSYIPDIIKEESNISVKCIDRNRAIDESITKESRVIVCDVLKEEDIDSRLDELIGQKKLRFIAGCAALAASLKNKISFHRTTGQNFQRTKGMYVACGSLNEITKKQVEYGEKNGFVRKHLTMQQKLQSGYYKTSEGKKFLEEVVELCRNNKKVIMDSFDRAEQIEDFLDLYQVASGEVRTLISDAHGHIVEEIVKNKPDCTILMTGGDTLMGYMKLSGCSQIEPVCEIEQGVVLSVIEQNGYRQQIISKSGGFGTEDILLRIAEKILMK